MVSPGGTGGLRVLAHENVIIEYVWLRPWDHFPKMKNSQRDAEEVTDEFHGLAASGNNFCTARTTFVRGRAVERGQRRGQFVALLRKIEAAMP